MSKFLTIDSTTKASIEATASNGDAYFNTDSSELWVWDTTLATSDWRKYFSGGLANQFLNTYSMGFNGSSSKLSPSTNIVVNSGSPKSLSFWFRIDTTIPGNRNFCIFGNNTSYGYGFIVASTTTAYIAGGGTVSTSWASSTWYHVVMTSNGSSGGVKIYKDGSEISSGLNDFVLNCSAIGASNSNLYWHEGLIDEFAVWDKELSSTEVLEIHGSPSARAFDFTKNTGDYASKDNLIHFYRMGDFDLDPSTSITDLGSQGKDLTNTNSSLVQQTPQ